MIERAQAATDPLELLGLHYVREGANNGNRYIAMRLRKAWNLPHDQTEGFRYLDPYGAEQRPRWERFKQTLDAQTISEAGQATIIAAARDMFGLIMAMHADFELPPLEPTEQHAHGHPAGHA